MLRRRWLGIGTVALLALTSAMVAQQPVRLELQHTLRLEALPAHSALLSADGDVLALGGARGELLGFHGWTRKWLWTTQVGAQPIVGLALDPTAKRLACAGRHLTIHDARTGEEQLRLANVAARTCAWLADGVHFAYGAGRELVVHDGERASVRAVFAAPIRTLTAGIGDAVWFVGDDTGRVWRIPAAGEPILHRDHREGYAVSVALAVAGGELFDLAAAGPLRRGDTAIDVAGSRIAFTVTPDGRSFAVAGEGNKVRWWSDGGASCECLTLAEPVTALALRPEGRRLLVATASGAWWWFDRGFTAEPVQVPYSKLRAGVLAPDGMAVALQFAETSDWQLRPLDGRPGTMLPGAVHVARGRRGAELLVQYRDRVAVLDARSGKELHSQSLVRKVSGCVVACGPGDLLHYSGELTDPNGTTVTRLREAWSYLGLGDGPSAFAPDGRWAIGSAPGSSGGRLLLTDAGGRHVQVVDEVGVGSVAFSPNGTKLVYTSADAVEAADGTWLRYGLRVRNAATLELQAELRVGIHQWEFLDDQRALVAVDGKLQVWDVEKLEPVQTLQHMFGDFQLSDDRRTLLLQGDGEMLVYRVVFD